MNEDAKIIEPLAKFHAKFTETAEYPYQRTSKTTLMEEQYGEGNRIEEKSLIKSLQA